MRADALVFEVFAPDRLATTASASWVATLNHELLDNTVKNDAVVVAVFRVSAEIFASFGCDIVEQLELDAALCGFDDEII